MGETVTEKPVLFSGPMVRAILDGRKTVTRRVVKPQPAKHGNGWMLGDDYFHDADDVTEHLFHNVYGGNHSSMPYGGVYHRPGGEDYGDRLWVRETWRRIESGRLQGGFDYRADDPSASGEGFMPWKPSIHMPRGACRLTLEITDVKVERLQDITEEQAIAEGLEVRNYTGWGDEPGVPSFPEPDVYPMPNGGLTDNPIQSFSHLWGSINGAGSWDANPWVWAISFRRVPQPAAITAATT